jgi:hypothetical protein
MRAGLHGVDAATRVGDVIPHSSVNLVELRRGHQAFPDTLLVGDDDDLRRPTGENARGSESTGKEDEVLRRLDVAFHDPLVDDSVTVEEKTPRLTYAFPDNAFKFV